MKKYRSLTAGETILPGDEWHSYFYGWVECPLENYSLIEGEKIKFRRPLDDTNSMENEHATYDNT